MIIIIIVIIVIIIIVIIIIYRSIYFPRRGWSSPQVGLTYAAMISVAEVSPGHLGQEAPNIQWTAFTEVPGAACTV